MDQSIFFPHFYLANDTLFRHLYLYSDSMTRVHPCDRPGRDSKPVKQFLKQLEFTRDYMPTEYSEDIALRTMHAVTEAYEKKNPLYMEQLGKHEKQRTSAKTFHLCRVKVWPDVSERLVNLVLAKNDDYDEWCFATRRMVLLFTTGHALHQQRELNLPRCTDDVEFDELAQLIECLPLGNESDTTIQRGVFEFPYVVPKTINDLPAEQLADLRDNLHSVAKPFFNTLKDCITLLEQAGSAQALNSAFQEIGKRFQDDQRNMESAIRGSSLKPETVYAQHRWYIPANAPLASETISEPEGSRGFSLTTQRLTVAASNEQTVRSYPGCFVWNVETPRIGRGGFLQRLFG